MSNENTQTLVINILIVTFAWVLVIFVTLKTFTCGYVILFSFESHHIIKIITLYIHFLFLNQLCTNSY